MKGRTAGRPYVCLDLGFHSDPKVMAVGNGPAGLFAKALSYCGYHRTDGFVPELWARANGTRGERQKLVDAGLWTLEGNGYRVPNWTRYQQTRAEVEETQRQKREAGKRGAEARWGNGNRDGTSDGTRHSNSDGKEKEKEKLTKTLTSSLSNEPNHDEDFSLPTAEELQQLAQKNGLKVPEWAGTEEKDIAF